MPKINLDVMPQLSWFKFPKSRPLPIANSFAGYEGFDNPALNGPQGLRTASYTSPTAPENSLPTRVLYDGANKVAF